MNRETSIKAYHEAIATGLIKGRRAEVLEVIAKHGPITSMEVFKIIDDAKPDHVVKVGRYNRSRFSELRDMGVIEEVGKRKDSVTGYEVIVYDMTGRAPVALGTRTSRTTKLKQAYNKALLFLENGSYWLALSTLRENKEYAI